MYFSGSAGVSLNSLIPARSSEGSGFILSVFSSLLMMPVRISIGSGSAFKRS